jgi:hypothetical protein
MGVVIDDRRLVAQRDGEVLVDGAVVREVVGDELALVPRRHHELVDSLSTEDLHDVPEDGLAADLDHGLGTEFGLFPHAGAEATGEEYGFHAARSTSCARRAVRRVEQVYPTGVLALALTLDAPVHRHEEDS